MIVLVVLKYHLMTENGGFRFRQSTKEKKEKPIGAFYY
eukprot:SAG11_NODE_632_length_8057_cov_6.472481_8_plen_38_part_00